jgi:hypothetical protein
MFDELVGAELAAALAAATARPNRRAARTIGMVMSIRMVMSTRVVRPATAWLSWWIG